MLRMKRFATGAAASILALAAASAVHAQETTGGIRGQITDQAGDAIEGASIRITHVPTGTSLTTVTGENGFFVARGLRVGGPYSIQATASNHDPRNVTIAGIGVADPAVVNLVLGAADTDVSEVVVTAARHEPNQGSGTDFTNSDLTGLPSISRDLKDVARLDPFASIDPSNQDALSFAGTNTRFNQFTVDGIRQNDDFGLNNNGYPTQRSPISIDAVQAVQVSISPFSVRNNGFLGGSINAVTKSGTNEFHGSIFGEKSSDSMRGDSYSFFDTRAASPTLGQRVPQKAGGQFDEKTWGATLGGPIIKDKLFFFLSYDKYEGNFFLDEGPSDSGRASLVPRISMAALNTFQTGTNTTYGIDPGNWVQSTPSITDEKILAKIDWDISDIHRLAVTYQDTSGQSFNGSTADLFAGGDSTTQPRIGLSTYQYLKDEHLTTLNGQLNSRWTDSLSTELRIGHKETETNRITPGAAAGVGEVTVTVSDLGGVSAGSGTPQIRFGTEINSQPNYLDVKVDTAELVARYSAGPHELMGGVRMEKDDITNIFGRNYLPNYTFTSYANFLAKTASGFSMTGAIDPSGGTVTATPGTAAAGAAKLDFKLYSFFLEDTYQVADQLSILLGVRYDRFAQSDVPLYNATFFSRQGFSNQQNLDGRDILLPRIYAHWTPTSRLDVSLGVGRFSSQGLNVWIANPYANDGVRVVNAVCPAGPYTNVSLKSVPTGCTFTPGNGNTNVLDPYFKIPSVWKTNFSIGYDLDLTQLGLGDDWHVQLDAVHAKMWDSAYWVDLRSTQIGQAPDGRPVYGRTTTGTIGANVFDMMLSNLDNGGRSNSLALSLAKDWSEGLLDGLSIQTSLTRTRALDRNPMTSSIADSSYVRFASTDHQNPSLATSDYEIRNKFSATVAYEREFFGDNKTNITVYFQQRSGLPFSYTFDNSRTGNFDNDFGNVVTQTYSGRQAQSNQLLYVPMTDSTGNVTATSDPKVIYAAGFNLANFNSFLKNTGLIGYAGKVAPRNAFRGRTVTTIDLHLSQEFPAFFPQASKFQVYADIENFGNLLNDKWGATEQYDFYRGVPTITMSCVGGVPAGTCAHASAFTYSALRTAAGTTDQPFKPFGVTNPSLWQVKLGVRYRF